ncbi:MAG: UDP-N-acetylglucosamine 1-carboxyvinyltransferase [Planctomycetota bacterium]|nr:MAG: UDP-N-acetylglucosamine 1-carboxyvinyltransferase [Planctomycetota bacterium]
MDAFVIEGGRPLHGVVPIGGAKNAALPILAATILAERRCVIKNVPLLRDVDTLGEILRELGVSCERRASDGAIETETVDTSNCTASYDLVRRMRASFCVLGPLLARRGHARVSLPGGCVFGLRPVDLHIKGLRALGAEIRLEHGYVVAKAPRGGRLHGGHVYLGGAYGPSVTGTANVMMAATLANGKTVIEGAACEPEIADLARFLVAMGATIHGIGTPRLEITGVPALDGACYSVIPDRIEAGTFAIAGALTGGEVRLRDARSEHLSAVIDRLREIGVAIERSGDELVCARDTERLRRHGGRFRPADIVTHPYPGFPTDLQAQTIALLSIADGISVVTEKIYPDRFMHLAELNRMGAAIRKEGPSAIITGVERLTGTDVMASDLRASAALVLAGLVAEGTTRVHRVYHIDRGYERIEAKLAALGARIRRVDEQEAVAA